MANLPETVDCLIIGTGIAGLTAAIAASKTGKSVRLITAAESPVASNTALAQGGIIYQSLEGDPDNLISDIMKAGANQNYPRAVSQLAVLGPKLVKKILLDQIKVPFDRNDGGDYNLTLEGAHGAARILHRGDESGLAIENSLYEYCLTQPTIQFAVKTTAVNLLMTSFHANNVSDRYDETRCFGAFVYDQSSGRVTPVYAHHTILATGGLGQVYLHNTNSKFARGDGVALAHRAGCRLTNLEYVQFHPTTFYQPSGRRFLISEAIRGEGGILIDADGQRFMGKHLKDFKTPELAPRDKVARAIHEEMLSSQSPCVYLDISHKPAEWIKERFPFIYRSCLARGVDITIEPIPVVPGAHYHCGGVWVDLEGRTSVNGLWAVGEVACTGVHGANRLASTSLLEGLVWGHQAGNAIQENLKGTPQPKLPEVEPWQYQSSQVDSSFLRQDWQTLKQTMWNYVGLIKTETRLRRAQGIITELENGIESFYRRAVLSDELIGLRHACLTSRLVLKASIRNPKSLGCYQREDWEI